jgi:hypothetical protein
LAVARNAIVSIGRRDCHQAIWKRFQHPNHLFADLPRRRVNGAPQRFEQIQKRRDRFGKDPVVLRV